MTDRSNVRALTDRVMAKPAPKVDTSGDGTTLSSRLGAIASVLDAILSNKGPKASLNHEMIRSLAADLTNASINAHRLETKIAHHHSEKEYWMQESGVRQVMQDEPGPTLSFPSQKKGMRP